MNHKSFIYNTFLAICLIVPTALQAQWYASQNGRLLDQNNRIGQAGINAPTSLNVINARMNAYVTGNVTGGASFQGVVPYGSINEFRGTLGSSTLSNFRRDSTGVADLGQPMGPKLFVDPSRSVSRSYGRYVTTASDLLAQRPISASTITAAGPSVPRQQFGMRPLSRAVGLNLDTPFARMTAAGAATSPHGTTAFQVSPFEPLVTHPTRHLDQEPQEELQPGESFERPGDRNKLKHPGEDEEGPQSYRPRDLLGEEETPTSPFSRVVEPTAFERMQAENAMEPLPEALETTDEDAAPPPGATTQLPAVSSRIQQERAQTQASTLQKRSQGMHDLYLEKGVTLMQEGKFYKAANAFENATIFVPDSAAANLAKSWALVGAGEFMSASFFLKAALRLDEQMAGHEVELERIFVDQEALATRLEDLEKWRNQTNRPMLNFLAGYIRTHQGDFAAAATCFRAAADQAAPEDLPFIELAQQAAEKRATAASGETP